MLLSSKKKKKKQWYLFSCLKNVKELSHLFGHYFFTEVTKIKKILVIFFSPLLDQEMKNQGIQEDRLQLLSDVSGAFRPGVLTALVGVSGAGKTTLMDVLAGRKTGGYISGSISISGYPKKQETFDRISGYCEQNDIHSPYVTVYESLVYSAWLRLDSEIDKKTQQVSVHF